MLLKMTMIINRNMVGYYEEWWRKFVKYLTMFNLPID